MNQEVSWNMVCDTFSVELTKEQMEILRDMLRVRIFDASYLENEAKYVAIFQQLSQAIKMENTNDRS